MPHAGACPVLGLVACAAAKARFRTCPDTVHSRARSQQGCARCLDHSGACASLWMLASWHLRSRVCASGAGAGPWPARSCLRPIGLTSLLCNDNMVYLHPAGLSGLRPEGQSACKDLPRPGLPGILPGCATQGTCAPAAGSAAEHCCRVCQLNLQSASGLTVGTRQQARKLGGSCLSYGGSRAAAWQEAWSLSGPLRRTMPGPL